MLDVILEWGTFAAAIRLAVPVALAALGALVAERAGVLNLGLEGMMLAGALGGYAANEALGSAWLGMLGGAMIGVLAGCLLALIVVTARANQVVTGIALTLLAVSATTYVFQLEYAIGGIPPRVERLGMAPLIMLTVALAAAVWFLFSRTTFGLALIAIGESPESADALGYRVERLRWIAAIISGALAGLGGAALVNGPLGLFVENVTAGRGWVALALVVFAGWRPGMALVGAVLFGLSDAIQLRLQGTSTSVPYEVFLALPYLVTLIALVLRARSSRTPTSLGIPYVRGSAV